MNFDLTLLGPELLLAVWACAVILVDLFMRDGVSRRSLLWVSLLGLILAGALGNLYDRVVFNGVRDFLYFYLIDWPVFNVADCCLVCGAFLLLGQAFLGNRAATDAPAPSEAGTRQEMAEVR